MASIRNVSGRDIFLAGVGSVKDGEVAEVPDERLYEFTASANFEAVGADSKTLHAKAEKDEAKRVKDEEQARRDAMGGNVEQPAEPVKPAKRG